MTKFDQDLISGSVTRSVWKLAWPVILAHLVSGIHGFIDQALVGHFVPGHGANGVRSSVTLSASASRAAGFIVGGAICRV